MSKEYEVIESLKKQVTELGAGEAHMEVHGVGNIPEHTAVISFYDGQAPSHKVLDKLYEWADTLGKTDVLEAIEQFSQFEEEEDE